MPRTALVVLTLLLGALAVGAGLLLSTRETAAAEPEVTMHLDVVYGRGGETDLAMDVAAPTKAEGPLPCLLVFHGGGWIQGNKAQFRPLVRYIAEHGYVAATVQYRLSRPGRGNPNAWPAQIEDAKCAVRYMRAHAKRWNIDPDRIAAMGFSAGAHLSMLLGTMDPDDGFEGSGGWREQPSKVNAVVGFYGPTCMGCVPPADRSKIADLPVDEKRRVLRGFALSQILGGEFAKDPSRASPLTYVNRGDAPMLLFQGTKDTLVPPEHAELMIEALTKARVPGKAVFMLGLGHGWRGDPHLTNNVRDTQRFLDEQFRPDQVESLQGRLERRGVR